MTETMTLIAIPAIAFVVAAAVVIRSELKTQKLREVMFKECKRCPLYGGDENAETCVLEVEVEE
jgi:hypothetical protein